MRCFGGFIGIKQFWWRILDKNNIHSFHLCPISKSWWDVVYVPCVTNLRAFYAWVIRWHVTGILSLAEHWHGRRVPSNHVCAQSVTSKWHVIFLQHLARACSEQSRSTSVDGVHTAFWTKENNRCHCSKSVQGPAWLGTASRNGFGLISMWRYFYGLSHFTIIHLLINEWYNWGRFSLIRNWYSVMLFVQFLQYVAVGAISVSILIDFGEAVSARPS